MGKTMVGEMQMRVANNSTMGNTLQMIVEHMATPPENFGEIEFPFNIEEFCRANDKQTRELIAEVKELRELVRDSLSLTNLRLRATVNKEIAITLSDEWIERAKKLLGDVK
jgi:hypothetical protein